MTTLGYGDITPKNMNEKIFVSFVVMMSCFVFGFSMNQIGEIIKSIGIEEF